MSTLDDAYEAAMAAWDERLDHRRQAEATVRAFLAHLADNPPDEMVEAAAKAYYEDEPQVRPASDRRDKFGNWLDREPVPWEDYVAKPADDPNNGSDERRYACEMLSAALRSIAEVKTNA